MRREIKQVLMKFHDFAPLNSYFDKMWYLKFRNIDKDSLAFIYILCAVEPTLYTEQLEEVNKKKEFERRKTVV